MLLKVYSIFLGISSAKIWVRLSTTVAQYITNICTLDISQTILYNGDMTQATKIHYAGYFGWAVCGATLQIGNPDHSALISYVPKKVTCLACKRTKDFKEMMDEEPL